MHSPHSRTTMFPYFSQWESSERVPYFIKDHSRAVEDTKWHTSGAESSKEYAQWAHHLCGCACIKMVLSSYRSAAVTTFEIRNALLLDGGYIREGDHIKGLIYAPAVAYLKDQWNLDAHVHPSISTDEVIAILEEKGCFIASVHPSIREPKSNYRGAKGGHLILCFGYNNHDSSVIFHNPSGLPNCSQDSVALPIDTFRLYFAERGISVFNQE